LDVLDLARDLGACDQAVENVWLSCRLSGMLRSLRAQWGLGVCGESARAVWQCVVRA
jgi:hypothetical protein